MSLTQKLEGFESEWNGVMMPFQEIVWKLQKQEYPESLTVFHRRYGTLDFSKVSPIYYICDRMGPPFQGTRGGIARSFGTLSIHPKYILMHIDDIFGNIISDIIDVQQRASAKLLKLQAEGARKMMNKSANIPRNIQNEVAQLIGEKKPVIGAYNVPNSFAKINTSLFKEGGKRKTRRNRRKSTRRHR